MFRTLLVRYAEFRSAPLFAGMLSVKIEGRLATPPARLDSLVCWSSDAHTRREDELARDGDQIALL